MIHPQRVGRRQIWELNSLSCCGFLQRRRPRRWEERRAGQGEGHSDSGAQQQVSVGELTYWH